MRIARSCGHSWGKQHRQLIYESGLNLTNYCRASYRSLLDTAETIIDMEARMEQVESKLARVGQNCNSRNLERITGNAVKMDTHKRSRGQSPAAIAL